MTSKNFIGLEIHDASLWEPLRVLPIIKTMKKWGYNALILHQNDLLDVCTQMGLATNYGVTDLRLKKVRNATAWLNKLIAELKKFDARLFLEIKEPSFHDYALEFYPDLIDRTGNPDPLHPAWADFCAQKVRDLLERAPELGGLIVNLSSPESRVSMPDHVATSSEKTDQSRWFDAMIAAFQKPLTEHGKELFVRDFSYTEDMQSGIMSAIERANGQVGASIKVTAHDYFPEFPENPAIRKFSGHFIVEFEAFGEHTGWGVIPNCRVEEFRKRMIGYRDCGANGILLRTSWEAIPGTNALDSLSAANVYALPKLITEDQDAETLVREWLKDGFGVADELAEQATQLLLESWHVAAAAYWNREVFPRHSCLPSSWQEGWLSKQTNGMGRRDHTPVIVAKAPEFSESNRQNLFDQKKAAFALAHDLAERAHSLSERLPAELAQLFQTFAWMPFFAKKFQLATEATFYAARGNREDDEKLKAAVQALLELADEISAALRYDIHVPYHHHVLFDPEQIRRFVDSLPTERLE